jgi:predicted HAD superfamily Cof-like phosphohydrolase
MSIFIKEIEQMNAMYKLPNFKPQSLTHEPGWGPRQSVFLEKFKSILKEEIDEIDLVLDHCRFAQPIDILTELADLLGDLVVYCHSEAVKYGIPLDQVLRIIMQSNFSKLPDNGVPIYDERGKFQKDPKNYWKPESRIKSMLAYRFDSQEK